ncbi:MAG: dihydrodipicolinate synthase family protein, partial [Bacilli bacterium]
DALSIPIILYNVPGRTGQSIPVEVVLELSKHPNIIGYKEASGDLDYLMELMAQIPDDFYVYSGNDDQVLPVLALGGKGVISVAANIIPNQMHDMVHSYLAGDVEISRSLQFEYFNLIKHLFIEVNPVPIKNAMNILGYNCGPTRLPLGAMESQNYKALEKVILGSKI